MTKQTLTKIGMNRETEQEDNTKKFENKSFSPQIKIVTSSKCDQKSGLYEPEIYLTILNLEMNMIPDFLP